MKRVVRILLSVILFTVIIGLSYTALGAAPYQAFNYSSRTGTLKRVPSPAPFVPSSVIDSAYLDMPLTAPEDIFVASDGSLYVVDSAENSLLILSSELKIRETIQSFELNGNPTSFLQPSGVFVCDDGEFYVADTGNARVVKFDKNYKAVAAFETPEDPLLGDGYVYKPSKLAVNAYKRIYVVAKDQSNGIIELDESGKFMGFIGSNMVNPSLWDLFWKKILTKEQREQMLQFVPLEYTSITLGDDFVYAVTQASDETKKVKKLSPDGKDILTRSTDMTQITKDAMIIDICVDSDGNYYYLDNRDGNIYVFNKEGYLLYAFGGFGEQTGTFRSPSAIDISGDKLYVADKVGGNVTVFTITGYASMIRQAISAYDNGEYEHSMELWNQIIKKNANFELGYVEMGRIHYRNDQYGEAMKYFKLGNYRGENYVSGYSEAFKSYRTEFLASNLGTILTAGLVLLTLLTTLIIFRHFRKKAKHKHRNFISKDISFAFYVLVHPFDGFWDLKNEKKGRYYIAFISLALWFLTNIYQKAGMAFLFNTQYMVRLDLFKELRPVLLLFLLFCVGNWSVTTLMDGKGFFKDIVMLFGYACLPMSIVRIPVIMLSNIASLDESAYIMFFMGLAWAWFIALLFFGIMEIHDFSLTKTAVTSILTVVSMLILVFICMISYNIFAQMSEFVMMFQRELMQSL